jgi:peptidoglycan/LPS O-acetylase OafA/YrhL
VAGAGTPAVLRALTWLGRWPLSYYMLHQPVLIGLLTAWVSLRGH